MQIITAAVIKGGTGKSTTVAALAQAAADTGKKVLVIDLDPQANVSFFIGADPNQAGSYQLLTGTDPFKLVQHTAQGIDAITAAPDLATLTTSQGSANRLQAALKPLKNSYDLCLIDTPPQMGEMVFNALQASTGLLIPLETDNSSLQGLYQIADIARQIQRRNPALSILGTILTRYDKRPKINRHLQGVVSDTGKEIGTPYLMAIRAGIAVREAQAMQQNLYQYAPKSKPAQDYKKLLKIITED